MSDQPQLHSSIVAMVSLASSIAANHPTQGLCQLRRLREMGVPDHQIDAVIEIARHIREEAGSKLDAVFDEEAQATAKPIMASAGSCCSSSDGKGCC